MRYVDACFVALLCHALGGWLSLILNQKSTYIDAFDFNLFPLHNHAVISCIVLRNTLVFLCTENCLDYKGSTQHVIVRCCCITLQWNFLNYLCWSHQRLVSPCKYILYVVDVDHALMLCGWLALIDLAFLALCGITDSKCHWHRARCGSTGLLRFDQVLLSGPKGSRRRGSSRRRSRGTSRRCRATSRCFLAA
jgi:hypothetical protein